MTAIDDSLSSLFGDEEPICPYTGLRTFTEEEAIYFRGRESHVAKCLDLLAAQRFVMITGASGDGKSSLVFAGLLPEVRAGFLRARYSSWAVATFRPERNPLRNLAQALATALRVESSAAAVETELEQGFSALVQLYQASPLCPPATLPEGLTPAEQRRYQLKSSNLLVVVDQFEEFFTNPENYTKDGPNAAAQTVVNLLLETTRLAQAENLPIYIVCTMRSDFVGQCAEFRGLIEQIGASQYFVPRLLRHEFVEVIKEPALLSGNRISERLVQRLLYDIRNGQDQLPVLQHALRRIWLAADQGREEMDLLHYAMVGGLSDELPAADLARFDQWRATVPGPEQQFLLADASLHNVLDAHANQLYYAATDLYNHAFEPALPPGTAERVIEQTFRLLTRTDGQRVVRNRLTGAEITAVINDEALPWPVVCRILRPFRQPGTTFLSPLLHEDDDDRAVLPPDAVLDITHESLIRNWDHLTQWAIQEADDVRVAQDFMQQANRWQANAENPGFLLPIGPYTYFSQWNRRKKSLANWLAHYVTGGRSSTGATHHQAPAEAQATVLTRFLAASRRRLLVPLLVARYGLGRLAAVVLLPVLLVGLGWWAWSARQQQSDYVAYSIIKERTPHLKSPFVSVDDKAHFLIQTDRLQNEDYTPSIHVSFPGVDLRYKLGTAVYQPWLGGPSSEECAFPRMLDALADDSLALNIELSMFSLSNSLEYDSVARTNPYTLPLLLDLGNRLDQAGSIGHLPNGQLALSARQREVAVCTARMIMALTYYLIYVEQQRVGFPAPKAQRQANYQLISTLKQKSLRRLYEYIRQEIQTTTGPAPGPVEFGFCLRVLLGQGQYSPTELAFLEGISPFGSSAARQQFTRFFPPKLALYAQGGRTSHSGGYLTSAIAFAALRQPAAVAQCLDSMRTQVDDRLDDADGGIAIVPYLVKYELFTPTNILELLHRCSKVGNFPFNEIYAATVYSLLSVSPLYMVHDVGAPLTASVSASDVHPGTVNVDFLNSDRVSFSLPNTSRDKAWQALLASVPLIASREHLFVEHSSHASSNQTSTSTKYQRNKLFLQAFLAKMHGTYLHAIKHQPARAAQEFAVFGTSLQALKLLCKPGDLVNSFEWNLGVPEAVGITEASKGNGGAQSPIRYLQEPIRPKTTLFETYYTCAFDGFFTYQLRHAFAQLTPDYSLIQLLDSVAFVEAAFPNRESGTRSFSLQYHALSYHKQHIPDLYWIKSVAAAQKRGLFARQQRNTLLLTAASALQNRAKLQQFALNPSLLEMLKNVSGQPDFARVPLYIAYSDLAAKLAYEGRIPEAFSLADALGEPMTTITKIRVSEQAMLTNNRKYQPLLDVFLARYQQQIDSRPLSAAGSIIAVLFWRPYANDSKEDALRKTAGLLIREGSAFAQQYGLAAMCKGRSLADESYLAFRDIPAYESERLRQQHFNAILLSLAHLKATPLNSGWHEYDETNLIYVTDYGSPLN
jgi:hypothetical protein